MVSVGAGTVNAGIGFDEIHMLLLGVAVAIIFLNVISAPQEIGVFETLDKRVFGYPTCEALICIAPSQESMTNAFTGITTLVPNLFKGDLISFVNSLITGVLYSFFVFLQLSVTLTILTDFIKLLYGTWYARILGG